MCDSNRVRILEALVLCQEARIQKVEETMTDLATTSSVAQLVTQVEDIQTSFDSLKTTWTTSLDNLQAEITTLQSGSGVDLTALSAQVTALQTDVSNASLPTTATLPPTTTLPGAAIP